MTRPTRRTASRSADVWTGVLCAVLVGVAVLELSTAAARNWQLLDFALSPPLFIIGTAGWIIVIPARRLRRLPVIF